MAATKVLPSPLILAIAGLWPSPDPSLSSLAAVCLLAAGGILYFRFGRSEPVPAAPAEQASPVNGRRPKFIEPVKAAMPAEATGSAARSTSEQSAASEKRTVPFTPVPEYALSFTPAATKEEAAQQVAAVIAIVNDELRAGDRSQSGKAVITPENLRAYYDGWRQVAGRGRRRLLKTPDSTRSGAV